MQEITSFVKKNKGILIKVGIAALLGSVVLFFMLNDSFVRFSGRFPFILNDSFNKTVTIYSDSRPSRFIFAITGGYKTGKSRILYANAQADVKKGFCPIVVDFGLCEKLSDVIDFLKLKIAESLTKFYPNLDSTDVKMLTDMHKYDYLVDKNASIQFPSIQISKIYSILATSLDSIEENGFNEYGIFKFFDVLSYYEPIFHFTIYIHNYDNIFSLSSNAIPKLGEKINDAAIARLSNGDQFTQFIPVYVEIKNSLRMINSPQNVKFFVTPSIEKESQQLVKSKVFRSNEFKLIQQEFGANPGVMTDIFEDLKYGVFLNASINNIKASMSKMIDDVVGKKSNKAIRMFCKNRDNFVANDSSMLESMDGLFANGLLFIRRDMKVDVANKAVADILCNLK